MESIKQYKLKSIFNWVKKSGVFDIDKMHWYVFEQTCTDALVKLMHQEIPSIETSAKKNILKFLVVDVYISILPIKFHVGAFYIFILVHLELFSTLLNIICKKIVHIVFVTHWFFYKTNTEWGTNKLYALIIFT